MDDTEYEVKRIPDYSLAEKEFLLSSKGQHDRKTLIEEILDVVKKEDMAPYYKHITNEIPDIKFDQTLYNTLLKNSEKNVEELQKKVKEAEGEDDTELDLLTTLINLAEYYTKIIDRRNASETWRRALELPQSTGSKIDILLTLTRIEFFFNDYFAVGKALDETKALIDKGGDWERRNRYKTYNGIYLVASRNFGEASQLLIDSLATFTSTELCSYEDVAKYSIVAGSITLDRLDFKSKVIDSPEILSIYLSAPELGPLVNMTNALYTCQYSSFLRYLLESHDQLLIPNRHLNQHANYFLREMRCKAYAQLLESYKSLSLKSMAQTFNLSEDFLDKDLCKFIPNKKLNCTIDKVNGIIETTRPDNKNSQYHQMIRQGDTLLTKLQKYGAAVKLSGAERVS